MISHHTSIDIPVDGVAYDPLSPEEKARDIRHAEQMPLAPEAWFKPRVTSKPGVRR